MRGVSRRTHWPAISISFEVRLAGLTAARAARDGELMERSILAFMSPTVFRVGRYRFFFFSREEERPHVHVSTTDGVAKFWIEPQIELARSSRLNVRELRRIERIIDDRRDEIRYAWQEFFGA
ncbi:MAG: DUF4160 domain-containing protein [Gemmatimonadota bacterium]